MRIREDRHNTTIFRSSPNMITPADEVISITMELVHNVEAERNTPLTIEVRDARTDEVITTATTTLMVAIENW